MDAFKGDDDGYEMPVSKIYQDIFSGSFMIRNKELMPFKHGMFPFIPVYAYLEDTGEKYFEEELMPDIIEGVPFQRWECKYCQYYSICPSELADK